LEMKQNWKDNNNINNSLNTPFPSFYSPFSFLSTPLQLS
jgi:hypothetical protein